MHANLAFGRRTRSICCTFSPPEPAGFLVVRSNCHELTSPYDGILQGTVKFIDIKLIGVNLETVILFTS